MSEGSPGIGSKIQVEKEAEAWRGCQPGLGPHAPEAGLGPSGPVDWAASGGKGLCAGDVLWTRAFCSNTTIIVSKIIAHYPFTQVFCLATPNLTSWSLGVAFLPLRGTQG